MTRVPGLESEGPALREELRGFVRGLWMPLRPHFSDGGARVRLGFPVAHFGTARSEFEAFARPLWGIAPLAAGGGEFDHWELLRQGVAHGTDESHAEHWGQPVDFDHLLVDIPAVAIALLLARDALWEPQPPAAKARVCAWLNRAEQARVWPNNWRFFPVLAGLARYHLGAVPNIDRVLDSLRAIDQDYLGDGWYSDGQTDQRDYYVAFAYHFYGLLCATLLDVPTLAGAAPVRNRLIERAVTFAEDFSYWFSAEGAGLPFGRSLTYRFAQCAFWGALAFANVEALPWGVIKGLFLRNLRWWMERPIQERDGVLSIGYAYPNVNVSERYTAVGSPYWAFKAFLPLALADDHAFWDTNESPLPPRAAVRAQSHAGMVFCEDQERLHHFCLSSGQFARHVSNASAKYGKFAYSSRFGFNVLEGQQGEQDCMLVFSFSEGEHRTRSRCHDVEISSEGVITSSWSPAFDAEVRTWLAPLPPWHVRVHRIRTARPALIREGGFCVPHTHDPEKCGLAHPGIGRAIAPGDDAWSGIVDLFAARSGRVVHSEPGANVLFPQSLFPVLETQVAAGECWFACAVCALPGPEPVGEWQIPLRWSLAVGDSSFLPESLTLALGSDGIVLDLKERPEAGGARR
jgi:hypothetical protein